MAFIAIQCPSCASTDVTLRGNGHYQCNHCSTGFLRRAPQVAPPSPPPPPPPRPLKAPINSYGPQPQPTMAPMAVHHASVGRFRWLWWMFFMVIAFAGPAIAGLASYAQIDEATHAVNAATHAATGQNNHREIVPRRPVVNLGSDPAAPRDASEGEAAAPPPPHGDATSLDQFQRLEGCSCRATAGSVDLFTRHEGSGTSITSAGTRQTMSLAFALKVGNQPPFTLPIDRGTAPPSSIEQGRFPLGMGCDEDTVVIATEQKVTGWSLEDRTERWTVDLRSSFGAVKAGDEPALDCKSISVRNGVASVRAGGKTLKVSLGTGEPPNAPPERKPEVEPSPPKDPKPDVEPSRGQPPEPTPDAEPKPAPEEDDAKAEQKKSKKKGKRKKGKRKKGKKKKGKRK